MKKNYQIYSAASFVKYEKKERPDDIITAPSAAVAGGHAAVQFVLFAEENVTITDFRFCGRFPGEAKSYVARYVKLTWAVQESTLFRPGYYPDALVPAESLQKEPASIPAGEGGSFWITFFVDRDAPAGVYPLKAFFTVDGEEEEIDFSLRVYPVQLPEDCSCRSCFVVRNKLIEAGEGTLTQELLDTYYQTLLDARINAYSLPLSDFTDPNALVAAAKKWFHHPFVKGYCLHNREDGCPNGGPMENYRPHILALAAASSPENDYLSKTYTYFNDEPECVVEEDARLERVENAVRNMRDYRAMLAAVAEEIERDSSGRYEQFKKIENWKERVLSIPNLLTMYLSSEYASLQEYCDIWVPSFTFFDNPVFVEKYTDLAKKLGKELWWYGCTGPAHPHPDYHISDALVTSRIEGWMRRAYGITGNLYWDAVGYAAVDDKGVPIPDYDPYENPYRESCLPAGDGNLLYPGRRYGVDGPLPSLRFLNICAANEDYELLGMAEERVKKLCKPYLGEIDVKSAVGMIYNGLFVGACCDERERVFDAAYAQMLNLLTEENPVGFVLENVRLEGNIATASFFVKEGAIVKTNALSLTKNGGRYIARFEVVNCPVFLEAEIEENGKFYRYRRFVCKSRRLAENLSLEELPSIYSARKDARIWQTTYHGAGNTRGVKIVLKPTDLWASFTLDLKRVLAGVPRPERVSCLMTNPSGQSLTLFAYLERGEKRVHALALELFEGSQFVDISFDYFAAVLGGDAETLCFEIRNTYPKDKEKEARVIVEDIRACY